MTGDRERRAEILAAAASLFGTFGARASLDQLAELCGIRAASLYHHFESKDAIYIELVTRFRADLDRIADRALHDPYWASLPPLERLVALSTSIAECGVNNRFALLLTVYEPPNSSSEKLRRATDGVTDCVRVAMAAELEAAKTAECVWADISTELFADRMCQSMLHVGVGAYHRVRGAEKVPMIKCNVLLHGLAMRAVKDDELDGSVARKVADEAIRTWGEDDALDSETATRIRSVARLEFARRGYDVTTMRDIAAAAGLSIGGVYRCFESKEALFSSIMQSYSARVGHAWQAVLASGSTPLEIIDASVWLHVNVTDRFAAEHKIQGVGVQYSPLKSPNLKFPFQPTLRRLKVVLAEGERSGELHVETTSADMGARCVFSLIQMPESIVHRAGLAGALQHGRTTMLRGVATSR